jgi:protein O-GlcNAc transferase
VNGKDQFEMGVRFGRQRGLHAIRSDTRLWGLAIFETIEWTVGRGSGMKKGGTGKNDRGRPARRELPPPEALRTAFAVYTGGNLPEAERLCRAVAAARPDSFDTWHLLGVIQSQLGKSDKALTSYDRALALRPDVPEALTNRGAALHDLGRFADALKDYEAALTLRPDFVHGLTNRGIALHALKRFEEALTSCDAALAAQPRNPEALARRGAVLHELDRFEEALASYDRALALRPGDPETLYNRGNSLGKLHRLEEALASFDRALALRPDYPEALANRGAALHELKHFEEARANFDFSLLARPNDSEAHCNRGAALHELKRYDEALGSFDRALADRPDYVDALYLRGNTFLALKRFDAALANFDLALSIRPDHPHAFAAAADCAMQLCDWRRCAQFAGQMAAQVVDRKSIIPPYTLLGYSSDPALQLQCARNYVAQIIPSPPRPLWTGVAYLSADFRKHPVAYQIAGLIERHDRSRFEIIGISFGQDDESEMRLRLAGAFDQFHDVRGRSDLEVAELLHGLRVDIAVDLTGHTQDSRFGILAHRPAPIQVNYLGFPGTLGADFIDYRLADEIAAPPEHQPYFAEKIVRLPDSFLVNDSTRKISAQTPTRAEAGLPDEGFVFCCFNNLWKITPEVFDIWMRLIGKVDGSVLWLRASHEGAKNNLREEARARGIDPARLVFAGPLPLMEDHLARHRVADLFLDTLPYNAHTTACDALWVGLPLVTCVGAAFAGRVAASLLRALDLSDLAARDLQEYEDLALRLVREPKQLREIRDRLAHNRLAGALFDTDRFRRQIENAYLEMWGIWQRGEAPRAFDVAGK